VGNLGKGGGGSWELGSWGVGELGSWGVEKNIRNEPREPSRVSSLYKHIEMPCTGGVSIFILIQEAK
jgi:hypothetical protein